MKITSIEKKSNIRSYNATWLIMITMCVVIFLINLDITIVNLALPTIASAFHSQLTQLQWVISGYVIVGAMFIIAGGRLADFFGTKKICSVGILALVLGSTLAGLSSNSSFLILSRMIQGVGLAFSYPTIFIISLTIFPKKQHGIALGVLNLFTAVSWISGPLIGGVILHYASWRWIFLINIPLGLISFVAFYMLCPSDNEKKGNLSEFDAKGLVLLSIGLMLLMMSINQMNVWGVGSFSFIILICLSIFALLLFGITETRIKNPLIELQLLVNKQVLFSMFIRISFIFGLNALLFTLVFYLQNILGFTSVKSGFILMSMMAMYGIISPFSGKIIDSFGPKIPTIFAMLFFVIAFYLFAKMTTQTNYMLIIPGLLLSGITASIIFSSTNIAAVQGLEKEYISVTTSIIITGGFIGAALGVAVTGSLLTMISSHYLLSHLNKIDFEFTKNQLQYLSGLANGTHSFQTLSKSFSYEVSQQILPILKSAYIKGLSLVFFICESLCILGLLFSIFLSKRDKTSI